MKYVKADYMVGKLSQILGADKILGVVNRTENPEFGEKNESNLMFFFLSQEATVGSVLNFKFILHY